jgi:hypothetical protein
MTTALRRARVLGFGLVAAGLATTCVGVARGSGTGGPSTPEPAAVTQRCGVYERQLLPQGSVLVFVPCPDPQSPRCPDG